jgi:hypothetical protein
MGNIYLLLCDNGDVPSGWTEISSSYHNRLLMLGTYSFLSTGGSETHTHNATTKTSLASGGASNSAVSSGFSVNIGYSNHTHTASSAAQSLDAGTGTSWPFYKNYRMIYKNINDFNGVVPANVACLRGSLPSSSEPDYDHWVWDENADCYIRIAASYGGTGGADNHTHPTTLGWNTQVLSTTQKSDGSVSFVKGSIIHGHTSTGITSQGADHTYKWWGAGVCKVTEQTNGFPAGSYAWFDDSVSSAWTAVSSSYNGYFCKNRGSANRTVAQGGTDNTHTHEVTGDSGTISSGTSQVAAGGSSAGVLYSHVHAITGGVFESVLPVPPYVVLRLASIDETLAPMQTRTKTYDMDLVLKKINSKTYTSDLLVKKLNINKTYAMDLLIKKNGITKSIDSDILIKKACIESFNADILLKKFGINKTYQLDILLAKHYIKTYQIDILLLEKGITKGYSIDLLLKKSYIKTYTSDLLLKRLGIDKSYIMDLLIKKNEIIKSMNIDILVKKSFVKIYNIDILLKNLNNKVYQLDILLAKRYSKIYQVNVIILKKGIMKNYSIDILLTSLTKVLYQADILIKKYNISKTYQLDIAILKRIDNNYIMDILVISRFKSTYEVDLLIKKIGSKTYQLNVILQKNNINKAYQMDLLLSSNDIDKTYQMSMLIYRIGIKNYQANLLLYKTSSIRYSFGIKIISYGSYRKRRNLSLDDIQPKITIQRGFDKYTFDPIVDQLKIKDGTGKDIQQIIEINKGFDEYVFDPMIEQLRRKRNL